MALIPIAFALDSEFGVAKLGFSQRTFKKTYVAKPDYLTQTLFTAEKTDLPEHYHA